MSKQHMQFATLPRASIKVLALAVGAVFWLSASTQAAPAPKKATKPVAVQVAPEPAATPIEFASQVSATVGKSTQLRLPAPVSRISVGNPAIADVILLNPREIYLLGKAVGSTNITLWNKSGQSTVVDVAVGLDTNSLQGKLQQLLPNDKNIKVIAAADTIVLSGTVTDAVKANRAAALAEAFAGKKVVNMLGVASAQQVMLEVKIAEINRTLLEKLGLNFSWQNAKNFLTFGSPTTLPTDVAGVGLIGINSIDHVNALAEAQKQDGAVKILAEPNIVAISGQEGSFLAGGEILIPVANGDGAIDLESKEFGVGLKFTPTVLEDGQIHMRVAPEVTDLVGFTNVANTSVFGAATLVPTLTTRRVSTAVELKDGQSLAIGGLLHDKTNESINRFPLLGEIPILGALFRSSEFQKSKTELVIVVTPRLVKPLPPNYTLPTDNFKEPNRAEFLLGGVLEGGTFSKPDTAAPKPDNAKPQNPAASGFEMK